MRNSISSSGIGVLVAATFAALAMMALPAQARVLPGNIIDQLQARTADFIHADGYTEVDGQTLPGDDWYTPARFPALGPDYSSVFWPDRDLDAVTRMILLVQSREKPLPHVRYRVTYRLASGPGDYPNVHRSFIQITRFNLGPTLYQYLLATANGRYPVAPAEIFGIGPHVSWRFVTRSNQSWHAAVVSASRKEIGPAAAQAANCLGQPCLALTDSRGPAGDWRQPTLPQFKAPVYGDPESNMPGPARVAEYLFAYATRNGFEPAAPAFADQPQLIFVISKNVEGQDATINGLLHRPHLMDDAIAEIWTRRLQAGPQAIDWRTLAVSARAHDQASTPAGGPRFEDYPVAVYAGPPARLPPYAELPPPSMSPRACRAMQEALSGQPDLAGEYVVVSGGCGTGKNRWHTTMNRTGGGRSSVVVTVDAVVHSPTRITEKQVFDMNGYFDCRSIAEFELNWIAATATSDAPDE